MARVEAVDEDDGIGSDSNSPGHRARVGMLAMLEKVTQGWELGHVTA